VARQVARTERWSWRPSFRAGRPGHTDWEVRAGIRAARRGHAALRAGAGRAIGRRQVTAALATRTHLIAIATLSALSAVERIVVERRVGDTRVVAILRSVRTIVGTRAVETNAVAAISARPAIVDVGIEVHAEIAIAVRQSRTTSALTVIAELRPCALRPAHAAVAGIGAGIDAAIEHAAIRASNAHTLTGNTGRTEGTLVIAATAEAGIRLRVCAELLAILTGADLLASGALTLS